jgi:hypothetical protein
MVKDEPIDAEEAEVDRKPGQKYPTPSQGSADRVFYESLYRQKPQSEMAQDWCIAYGVLPHNEVHRSHIFGALMYPLLNKAVCTLSSCVCYTVVTGTLGWPLIQSSVQAKRRESRSSHTIKSSKGSCKNEGQEDKFKRQSY